MTSGEKIKKWLSYLIYKIALFFRKIFLKYGILKPYKGRQPYHIGWLAPDKTLDDLKIYLHGEWGFGNHFANWEDKDQVLSWRKLLSSGGQYHLRVFNDGEIRGHFESTPEEHPLGHIEEKDRIEAKIDFLKFLGDFVVEKKHPIKLKSIADAYVPDAEILKEEKLNPRDFSHE